MHHQCAHKRGMGDIHQQVTRHVVAWIPNVRSWEQHTPWMGSLRTTCFAKATILAFRKQ